MTKPADKPILFVRREGTTLVPHARFDADLFDRFRSGVKLRAELTEPRQQAANRFYWAVLKAVCDATGRWPNSETLHKALKLHFGVVDTIPSVHGEAARLPAVSLDNPLATLSLPAWCASRIEAVSLPGEDIRRDGKMVPTIPAGMALTEAMRRSVAGRLPGLEALMRPGPRRETLGHVGKMLLALTKGTPSVEQIDAKTEVYDDVLSDVPAWAVGEAIRLWHRREAGPDQDYRWTPDAAVLRKIAVDVVARQVRSQDRDLRRLLDAVALPPPKPLTDEERADLEAKAKEAIEVVRAAKDVRRIEVERPVPTEAERQRAEALLADLAERKRRNEARDAIAGEGA